MSMYTVVTIECLDNKYEFRTGSRHLGMSLGATIEKTIEQRSVGAITFCDLILKYEYLGDTERCVIQMLCNDYIGHVKEMISCNQIQSKSDHEFICNQFTLKVELFD